MPKNQQRAYEISKKLKCPVCEGQTVAGSDSLIAQDMRAYIEKQLDAGAKEQQIVHQLVTRYGEQVQVITPMESTYLWLWLFPVVFALLFMLWRRFR